VRDASGATSFQGYDAEESSRSVSRWRWSAARRRQALKVGDKAELVFDRSPFYAESGGQAGDTGEIFPAAAAASALTTFRNARAMCSCTCGESGRRFGQIRRCGRAEDRSRAPRRASAANHSATHLLHAALRHTLGKHVTQKGSLVEADCLRFDFSHTAADDARGA